MTSFDRHVEFVEVAWSHCLEASSVLVWEVVIPVERTVCNKAPLVYEHL
jgi:hypothetical protein